MIRDAPKERTISVQQLQRHLEISGDVNGVDVWMAVALQLLEAQPGRSRIKNQVLQLLIGEVFQLGREAIVIAMKPLGLFPTADNEPARTRLRHDTRIVRRSLTKSLTDS